jgi:lipopolysaccharide transport system ATP-binding protein
MDVALAPLRRFNQRAKRSSEGSYIWALKDLCFEVQPGELVGIIGRNGAGKSTLLKILSRITEPTVGRVELRGRVGSLLEVGTGFHPELTGRENIFLNGAILGMSRAEISRKFDEIVAFAEIDQFLDTPVKRYSSGMYVRLAFAVAAHLEPEVLVVDEVLAVGDAAFQKKCLGKMSGVARQGRTVLFVSHNMGAVSNLCERGILLEAGRIVFSGTARDTIQQYNQLTLGNNSDRNGLEPHILYENGARAHHQDFAVTRIELLDMSGNPKPIVSTWDPMVVRVTYWCAKSLQRGSVEIMLSSADGSRLLLLSTQPDGTMPLTFEVGVHQVECVIEKLPLAAGQYTIGAALAIPGIQWLWRSPDLAALTIVPRDVYGSGLAPAASRSLLALEHHWRRAAADTETIQVSLDRPAGLAGFQAPIPQ